MRITRLPPDLTPARIHKPRNIRDKPHCSHHREGTNLRVGERLLHTHRSCQKSSALRNDVVDKHYVVHLLNAVVHCE
jgi:hypothetical protein